MNIVTNRTTKSIEEDISFIAKISFLKEKNRVPYEMIMKSLRNGIYARETLFPTDLFCIRDTPEDTVLASLNNAWVKQRWNPVY